MNENIIFFFIIFLIGAVLVAILVFVIISIFRLIKNLIKKIFQKDDDLRYAENLEVAVPELEESRKERQKIADKQQEFRKNYANAPKFQYTNTNKPNDKKEEKKDQEQIFDEKEKRDIEEGLGDLKKSGKKDDEGEDEENNVFVKIKIPRAKKVMPVRHSLSGEGSVDAAGAAKTETKGKINLEKPSERTGMAGGTIGAVKTGEKPEIIKGAEIKIPKTKTPEESFRNKQSVSDSKNLSSEISNKFAKTDPKIAGDDSIFRGKSEVSRIELRQKLRYDPKIWQAEKRAGLNLNSIERSKLEKEVFSQTLGRNISKTDLKWGIKKLNQKMLNTKNLSEKGKIRKEIKFFKKIGGIK